MSQQPIKYIYQYECCDSGYYGPATNFREAYELLLMARANHQLIKWCTKNVATLTQITNIATGDVSTIRNYTGLPECFKEKTA